MRGAPTTLGAPCIRTARWRRLRARSRCGAHLVAVGAIGALCLGEIASLRHGFLHRLICDVDVETNLGRGFRIEGIERTTRQVRATAFALHSTAFHRRPEAARAIARLNLFPI